LFVDFFIQRPVFATVCSLFIILAGAISIPTLPIAEFPDLAPPQVIVGSVYIGANAQTVESAVTIPLEQAINGVQGMKYITSTSGNDGTSQIIVVFDVTRNVDLAAVDVQNRVNQALARLGHDVRLTGNAATLWRWVADGDGDLVITDVIMPDENGLDLIPRIKKVRPELRIIVMSAQSTLMTAVKATERGAFEYLPKPFDLRELVSVVERALSAPNDALAPYADEETEDQLPLIGRSSAMQEIYRVLARLMGTDLTVMIMGESGTGKELVARALHNYGKRRNGPFVAINMAAIPRELIESELFGHEKGAFTGATSRGIGRFEQAQGGTLFLDEIGDMPIEAQTRLLRVLQEGEFTAVGGRVPIRA